MASNLIVLAFDNMEEAEKVHQALVHGKKEGLLQIDDAAVIVKDADGKVHVKNQISQGAWSATGVGGLLGLLLGAIFFPIGGLVLGLAGGALVGRMMNVGVDGKFVKDVEAELKPGTSAIFVLGKGDHAAARPYYERALAIRLEVLGEQHPDTASSLNNMGYLLQAMGDHAAARPYYERALAIRLEVLGEQHPDTATQPLVDGGHPSTRGRSGGRQARL